MAHIYILKLDPDGLRDTLSTSGWIKANKRMIWSGKSVPLKQDSISNPSEDLANHIEDYLHERDGNG